LRETIARHGLFGTLYTDRGGHYFQTRKAGGKVDNQHLTQVGRALLQFGIRHIASYSPQGRGRIERVFGTLHNRLPPGVRVARIRTLAAVNRYLRERFIANYNARFAVSAAELGEAFVAYAGTAARGHPVRPGRSPARHDNCVMWCRLAL